jgi:hypothetical protein
MHLIAPFLSQGVPLLFADLFPAHPSEYRRAFHALYEG